MRNGTLNLKEDLSMIKRIPLTYGVFLDEKIAKRYNKQNKKKLQRISKSFIFETKRWGITEGKVLDVGTGTGILAIEFARNIPSTEVIGLDLSDMILELARENVQKCKVPLRISFKIGNAEDMPFKNDTFDLVISLNTLHLLKNPVRMLNEIQRVLKPDGKFFLSDHRRSCLGLVSKNIRAAYSPKEMKNLLRQSKLQNWKVKDYFFWLSIFSKG